MPICWRMRTRWIVLSRRAWPCCTLGERCAKGFSRTSTGGAAAFNPKAQWPRWKPRSGLAHGCLPSDEALRFQFQASPATGHPFGRLGSAGRISAWKELRLARGVSPTLRAWETTAPPPPDVEKSWASKSGGVSHWLRNRVPGFILSSYPADLKHTTHLLEIAKLPPAEQETQDPGMGGGDAGKVRLIRSPGLFRQVDASPDIAGHSAPIE